jgi:hypothetical protein
MTAARRPTEQNGRWRGKRFPDKFSLIAASLFSERRCPRLRKITGLLAALLFATSLSASAQDGKEKAKELNYDTVIGTFESYKREKLTLLVDKQEGKEIKKVEKVFAVSGDTPVGYSSGKDKQKILKARVHLKDVKKGSIVSVTLDGKKVLAVGVFVTELPKDEKAKDE